MARTMRVFDTVGDADDDMPATAIHVVSGEMWGNGNDSFFEWTIGREDEPGGGYITREEELSIDAWLKRHGGEDGETVLIKNWW